MIFYVSVKLFLDNGILSDDVNLDIPGYNLARADHLANTNRDGVFIFENLFL